MARWHVEREGAPGTRVELTPVAGEIVVTVDQPSAVFDALDGTRVVWQSRAQAPNVSIPELHFGDPVEAQRLRNLVTSGGVLTLVADTGEVYRVRSIGGVTIRTLDTPDRATSPKLRVALTLVGV